MAQLFLVFCVTNVEFNVCFNIEGLARMLNDQSIDKREWERDIRVEKDEK